MKPRDGQDPDRILFDQEDSTNDALRRPHFTPDDDGYWESRAELEHDRRSHAENNREVARNERCYGDL